MKFQLFLLSLFIIIATNAFSQEEEAPLRYNAKQAQRYREEQRAAQNEKRGGGGTLTLPFFDDFSRYSLPTSLETIPDEWQMWSDTDVFVNCTFPVAPLTIGVATLDGFKPNGQPYEWNAGNIKIGCDSLTSLPIDLSGFLPEDSLRLLFHYQTGGLGDIPDEDTDTLFLDFFKVQGGDGDWVKVWQVNGGDNAASFERVFIDILDPDYLQNGFKFRFRNWGRPGGSVDHWHLDYIILADGLDPNAIELDEVAFQYCNNTLLNNGLTSMPWTHYLSNPESFMADNVVLNQRNLDGIQNVNTRVEISTGGANVFTSSLLSNPNQAQGEFTSTLPLDGYNYSDPDADTEALFTVCASFNQTDAQLSNDTMCFDQVFSNYYAYDDGTAERGWRLNQNGARSAVLYNSVIPDTLLGVMIHWLPYLSDNSGESFLLRVYDVNGGLPGNELNAEDFNFYDYSYGYEGYNPFYYYALTEPIGLDGPFFMGWIQQNSDSVYIGNDKNTNMNLSQLYLKYDAFSNWVPTTVSGSIMFRPVFKSGMEDWVSVEENELPSFSIFPNPAGDVLNISLPSDHEKYFAQVFDMAGRVVIGESFVNNGTTALPIEDLANGVYTLRISSSSGTFSAKRFIKGQ